MPRRAPPRLKKAMFTATYRTAMTIRFTLLLLVITGLTVPLAAQFRTEKRAADKAYELSAYTLAIEGYRRALTERPDDLETLSRIADAYRMLNELDTARTYYERAMQGGDRQVQPATLLGYAQTLKSLGEYALARPLFEAYASEADQTVGTQYAASIDFAVSQQNETAGYSVAPAPFNSPEADFGPTTPRPDQVVFSSSRIAEGFSGVADNKPYLVQQNTLGALEAPVPLSTGYVSRGGSAGPVSYSPDGSQVVFTRNSFTPGTRMVPEAGIQMSLLLADVSEAGMWNNVRPLPFNGNGYSTGFGTFGADGQAIYFASDRPGGFGGYDLYRARQVNGNWETVPENLGGTVNSQGNEITPYFDGSSLYFSSDWHAGLGAYDIFRAALNDANRPTALFHLGGAVNSPRDDYGFVYDEGQRLGYLTSNRPGGRGMEDIYSVRFTEPMPGPATAVAATAPVGDGLATGPQPGVPRGVRVGEPVPFGTVRGYVSDSRTGGPVSGASVAITKRSSGQAATAQTDAEGAYYVEVEPQTVYDVEVNREGYESITFPVTTAVDPAPDAFGNILVLPIERTYAAAVAPPAPTVATDAPTDTQAAVADPSMVTTVVAKNFSVQVASVAAEPQLSAYNELAPLGEVYHIRDGDRYKVRVGNFATRDEALAAAQQVQNLGYAGSFVVVGQGPVPQTVSGGPSTERAPAAAPPDTSAAVLAPFRVQLGAFAKPENFDRAAATRLGMLGESKRDALTVFYLDGLQTISQAEAARNRAQAAGYAGAYILQLVDGAYVKQ